MHTARCGLRTSGWLLSALTSPSGSPASFTQAAKASSTCGTSSPVGWAHAVWSNAAHEHVPINTRRTVFGEACREQLQCQGQLLVDLVQQLAATVGADGYTVAACLLGRGRALLASG